MAQTTNNKALYVLMLNLFITMGGIGLIIPIMPQFLAEFGAGGQALGFLVALFALGQFLFSPIAGELSDRYGRKKFIIGGLILYGLSSILIGVAEQFWLLFVARFLTGIGAAFIIPPIMAFVADITTFEERGKGMSRAGAAISFGFMIGPAIGGFLSKVDIAFPFILAGIVAFVAAVLSVFLLPNVVKPAEQMATKADAQPKKRDNLFKQLALSTKTPYFVILIIIFAFSFGIANFQATLSIYLDNKFNYTPTDIAIIMTVGGFAGVVLQIFVIEKLFKRFGEMKVILVSLAVAAVSMLCIIFISGYFMMIFVGTVFSIATTFIRPAVNTLVSKMAGREQGFAAGMNNAYMSLGSMFGPALAGILFDWKADSPYIFGTFVLAGCFLLAYFWTVNKAPQLLKPSGKQQ